MAKLIPFEYGSFVPGETRRGLRVIIPQSDFSYYRINNPWSILSYKKIFEELEIPLPVERYTIERNTLANAYFIEIYDPP